jgi:hypothetical protein
MVSRIITLCVLSVISYSSVGQNYDSLRRAILELDTRIQAVELNLETAEKKFRNGILISTIGYTTTIVGGLMLGRENDEMGQVLLVAGGVTGVYGTYKMVRAFSFLTGKGKKENP